MWPSSLEQTSCHHVKFVAASDATIKNKVEFVVPIAHRTKVNSVTTSWDKRPSNQDNDPFISPHYDITLKDAEVQCSRGCTSQSSLCEGIDSCSPSHGYRAPFKTNNGRRAESFIIKSLKPL